MHKIIPMIMLSFFILIRLTIIGTTDPNNDQYDLVVITPMHYLNDLLSLKNHKENHGITTRIVTLDALYNNTYFSSKGRDNPEKIKYFIKNAHENWNTQYIMFIGGEKEMPVRFVESKFGSYYNFFISDLYYADIYDKYGTYCSWDSNQNNVFGEVNGSLAIDDVHLYPDVTIGRLLCSNRSEIQLVINKIINYENNAFYSEWFKRIVLFGGDTQPTFLEFIYPLLGGQIGSIAFEGEYMGNKIAQILDDFQAVKLYGSNLFRPKYKMLTTINVNEAINEGAGFVLFAGHGSPDKIWNYLPFSAFIGYKLPRPIGYTSNDVKYLNNKEKLPVILFCACSCGDFNYTPSPLAWEFIKNKNGGAIACIANTNPSYLIPSTLCTETVNGHLTMTFYEAYSEGIDILGDIWKETIVRYMNDKNARDMTRLNWRDYNVSIMTLEVWTLFGDPTLKIGGYQ
jgi:hypothetical protein